MSEPAAVPTNRESPPGGEYVVIARRYRPQTFGELVGQQHVARALEQAIASERVGHAYLFTGARGVGKTSAARILAKALNCERGPTPTPCNECDLCCRVSTGDDVDVLEIDGASNRGIDEIRQLRQNAAIRPSRARFKIYIIDEVHMLTKEAFNALLKTLEEPPEHVKFIFATTEPNKIPITILSRCQRFDFAGIDAGAIQTRLAQIAQAEGVELAVEAAQIIACRAAGSMRDSQSLLEQLLAVSDKRIVPEQIHALLGTAPIERLNGLVGHLVERNAAAALAEFDAALTSGVEVGQLLDQLIGYFRDVMAAAVGCPAEQLLYALPSQADQVKAIGRRLGLATILAIVQILDQTAARLRVSLHGRTLVEMAIVRICELENLDDLAGLIAGLRGQVESGGAAARTEPAKKNVEATPQSASLGTIPPLPTTTTAVEPAQPTAVEGGTAEPTPTAPANGTAAAPSSSVLKQFQEAVNAAPAAENDVPAAPRVSRRQQAAEQIKQVSARPFVKKALELFEVAPGQFRYSPPDDGTQ